MTDRRNIWLSATAAGAAIFLAVLSIQTCLAQQSTRSGWGSTPYADSNGTGVTFRVWAPNATNVTVLGEFNGWYPPTAAALYSEGTSGVWSVDVPASAGVKPYQEYKYLVFDSYCGSPSGSYRIDPRGRASDETNNDNAIIYDPNAWNWNGDSFTNPPLSSLVVYEMHIGSFFNPQSNNVPNGTFYQAASKLSQLQQLGVNAVELLPIASFPDTTSWGYDPIAPFAVENVAYGGPDGLKSFVQQAHQLGIAVLLDTVENHYANGSGLWDFDCFNGSSGTNGGGIYFYQPDGVCCTSYGPRPNYSQPQVAGYIQDNITMWLSEYHLDGFRWDDPDLMVDATLAGTNVFIPEARTMLQQINSMIHTAYTGKINIGENNDYQIPGFDAQWGYDFSSTISTQLTAANDSLRNMGAISYEVGGAGTSGWTHVIYMESHDTAGDLNAGQRLPALIAPSSPTSYNARKLSTLGSVLTMTSLGIPMLLEGEEMLTTNQFSATTPLNWTFANTYSGIVWLYKDLIRLRRNLDGVSSGLEGTSVNVFFTSNNNKVIAYKRSSTGAVTDNVMVVANFSSAQYTNLTITSVPNSGTWYTHFNSDSANYSPEYGNFGSASVVANGGTFTINIAPYSALILSQVAPPSKPPVPANLTATASNTNEIDLAWSVSPGATSYVVYRGSTAIATTSTNNYSDIGLPAGSALCYIVAAINVGGVSGISSQACATTQTAPNSWNVASNGKWETGGNWLSGQPSALQQGEFITNASSKVVTIDAVTTGTPGTMSVNNLTVAAPPGAANTLFLNNPSLAVPLDVLDGFVVDSNSTLVDNGGAIVNSNFYSATIGNLGGNASLIVTNGGSVSSYVTVLGWENTSFNNSLLIGGPGSVCNLGDLYVGLNGGGNRLTVTNSATAVSSFCYIGSWLLANSNTVNVAGNGALFQCPGRYLYLGEAGSSSNQLLIGSGGSVLAGVVYVGDSDQGYLSSNNVIQLNGGSLVVTNNGSGLLLLGNGGGGAASLILNNGTVTADRLVATNGANNIIRFNGGQFSSGGTAVINNQLFAVGTNGNAAAYTLLGGYHSFANNLEVRTNASLSGCGTINTSTVYIDPGAAVLANCGGTLTFTGNLVENFGVMRVSNGSVLESYATVINVGVINALNGSVNFHSAFYNEPGGVLLTSNSVPVITAIQAVPPDVQVSFTTSGAGATYGVAYTTNVLNATWTTLTNNIAGTGAIITVTDPGAATQPQRFYKAYLIVPPGS